MFEFTRAASCFVNWMRFLVNASKAPKYANPGETRLPIKMAESTTVLLLLCCPRTLSIEYLVPPERLTDTSIVQNKEIS
jgi:hypothetical protein